MGYAADPFRPGIVLFHHIVPGPVQAGADLRQLPLLLQTARLPAPQILNPLQDGRHGPLHPAGVFQGQKEQDSQIRAENADPSHHHEPHVGKREIVVKFYPGARLKARHGEKTVFPRPDPDRIALQVPAAEGGHLRAGIGSGQLRGHIPFPDHRSFRIQYHGPGAVFPQHIQGSIVGRPDALPPGHAFRKRADRKRFFPAVLISRDHNPCEKDEVHRQKQHQDPHGGKNIAPEKSPDRVHFSSFKTRRYPNPLTVSRETGREGSFSIFSRRWRIWVDSVVS